MTETITTTPKPILAAFAVGLSLLALTTTLIGPALILGGWWRVAASVAALIGGGLTCGCIAYQRRGERHDH